MKVYLKAFINFEQNNWVKLLPIAKFAYNNTKNASTGHIAFELNYGYHLCVFFKENNNPCLQLKTADKLSTKLEELMIVCQKNLYYAQDFQKQSHNKSVKPKSYASGDKVWLNNKYIKTK